MPRYIDADKLKLVLSEYGLIRSDLIALRHIDAMPTADVQEVKHGKWDGNGYLKNCSLCGTVVNFNEVSNWLYNYCPNCGARMDGETND